MKFVPVRAWTTYLHGPSTDKIGTGANFIRAVLQIERSVNGPLVIFICQTDNRIRLVLCVNGPLWTQFKLNEWEFIEI